MALISETILSRNFELIRNQIAAILTTEFAGQSSMTGVDVWVERKIPFTQKELPAVNVGFIKSDYDNKNVSHKRGTNTYFIDVYSSKASTDAETGDILASQEVEKMAGIIDYILEHPYYITLGFEPGFIEHTIIESIEVSDVQKQDSLHNVVARLSFKVVAGEDTTNIQPVTAEGYDTQVKIELTDYGFKYLLNN